MRRYVERRGSHPSHKYCANSYAVADCSVALTFNLPTCDDHHHLESQGSFELAPYRQRIALDETIAPIRQNTRPPARLTDILYLSKRYRYLRLVLVFANFDKSRSYPSTIGRLLAAPLPLFFSINSSISISNILLVSLHPSRKQDQVERYNLWQKEDKRSFLLHVQRLDLYLKPQPHATPAFFPLLSWAH